MKVNFGHWLIKRRIILKNSIEQVLLAWFDQQSVDSVMCHRLARQATAMAEEGGGLYLRIHPEKEALMRETFGEAVYADYRAWFLYRSG